jgi:hypothetical protein
VPGKKVLVSPAWIERVSWADSKVYVGLSRESIKDAPDFIESRPLVETADDSVRVNAAWRHMRQVPSNRNATLPVPVQSPHAKRRRKPCRPLAGTN